MRSSLVLGVPLLLVVAGCSVIAGVDFGDAHDKADLATTPTGGGGDDTEPGVAALPDPASGGCKADQKICNGACVNKSDPAYGCAADDCSPCSVPFAKNATCKEGQCAAESCVDNHGDCDGDTKNGCEASLDSPTSCKACGTVCQSPTSLCTPTGCGSSCPAGTTECNGGCVDTKTSLNNCGSCGNHCNAPANADPVCVNSTCTISCRTGFADCTNNPAQACNPLPKWYQDTDGDGYGSAVSVQACAAPGGYVAASGDCLDSNNAVHPGQATFFGTSFINAVGVESYDYDCSGVETDNVEHWPGSCDDGCIGNGYIPKSPVRSGAGQDAYCGSTATRYCIDYGGGGPIPVKGEISTRAVSSSPPNLAQGCQARGNTGLNPVGCH